MPEPISLGILFGLAKVALVKSGAAVGTKTALMHTAIATEGAVGSATTAAGAAGAAAQGGNLAYQIAAKEQRDKNKRKSRR